MRICSPHLPSLCGTADQFTIPTARPPQGPSHTITSGTFKCRPESSQPPRSPLCQWHYKLQVVKITHICQKHKAPVRQEQRLLTQSQEWQCPQLLPPWPWAQVNVCVREKLSASIRIRPTLREVLCTQVVRQKLFSGELPSKLQ